MKQVKKTGRGAPRRWLNRAVILLLVGGLVYGGASAYRVYSENSNNKKVVTTPQQSKRDPTKHEYSDIDYATKMLLYHQLAAQLADVAKERATRAEIRLIAEQYSAKEAQHAELYANLLKSWNEPYVNLTDFPEVNGCNGYPTFAGMLSHATVRDYRNSSDKDIDEQFLELMIEHHQGLTELVNDNGRLVGYGVLIQAKDTTLKSQNDEVERLNTMLRALRT